MGDDLLCQLLKGAAKKKKASRVSNLQDLMSVFWSADACHQGDTFLFFFNNYIICAEIISLHYSDTKI